MLRRPPAQIGEKLQLVKNIRFHEKSGKEVGETLKLEIIQGVAVVKKMEHSSFYPTAVEVRGNGVGSLWKNRRKGGS